MNWLGGKNEGIGDRLKGVHREKSYYEIERGERSRNIGI